MRRAAVWIALIFCVPSLAAELPLNPQGPIKTQNGQVVGSVTGKNESISVYKGIPYAAPPVGRLRWRPPEPRDSWKGVYVAREFGPVAPQLPNPFGGVGPDAFMNEDCLYLNIWTPAVKPKDELPVMVWIHGGGFSMGAGSLPMYDGTHLAERGVVVVTFNYRLNLFGSFAHPGLIEESRMNAAGNYGLLDQVAALNWVQRNIAAFGGDPDKVTIFGESAGGRSVSLHLVSEKSKGLFHRAIAQSGALRDTTGSLADREEASLALAAKMGAADLDDPVEFLRGMPWDAFPGAGRFPSNPIIDGYFMEENPEDVYQRGDQHDVPLIAGTNRDEATLFLMRTPVKTVAAYESYVRKNFGDAAPFVLSVYPAATDEAAAQRVIELVTDYRFTLHQRNQAKWMGQLRARTYLYKFLHVPPGRAGDMLGAHHEAEIRYVFGNLETTETFEARPSDHELSKAIMTYWVQFATIGDPNNARLRMWPQYDPVTDRHLELGPFIRANFRPRWEELDRLEAYFYPAVKSTPWVVPQSKRGKKVRRRR